MFRWFRFPGFAAKVGNAREEITGELHHHRNSEYGEETRHEVFDVKTKAALGGLKAEQRTVDDRGFPRHPHGENDPAERQSQQQGTY